MERKTKTLLLLDTLISSFLAGFFPELLEKWFGVGFPAKHYVTLIILAILLIIFLIIDERGKNA